MKKNKRNIAIIINSLKLGGGAERVATTIGTEFNQKGYNVYFLVFNDVDNIYPYKGEYFNIGKGIQVNNSLEALFASVKIAYRIKRYCKKNNINVAVSFMEQANFSLIFSKIFFKNHLKTILSIRESPVMKSFKSKILMRLFYRFADKVVVNSFKAESMIRELLKIKNLTTIYNPLDFDKINLLKNDNINDEEKKIFSTGKVFINIGRFTHQKGQKHLIGAFFKVLISEPTSKLVILGSGELESDLNNLVKKNKTENSIFFLGNKENVFKYLNRSDCFVFTSIWEGFPNALAEAFSVGLPLISTDCPTGPREIIAPELELDTDIEYPYKGANGILIKPFSIKMDSASDEEAINILSEAMLQAMDKSLPENSKKDLSMYKISNVIKQWEEII